MASAQKKKVDKRSALERANDFDFVAHEDRTGVDVLEANTKSHHDRLSELGVDKMPLTRLVRKKDNAEVSVNSTSLDDIATWKKQGFEEVTSKK